MRLSSLHCVSIGLSCGVYGGRNIGRMSPFVESMNLFTASDLWYMALSSTRTNFGYIFWGSLRNSMNAGEFVASTVLMW